uniref:Surfactant protein C n=1 Tax=Melopsittacus undulatus TaxID=13146 RepID=A0A8C6IRG8_MELUD
MDGSSKEALMEEAPPVRTPSPAPVAHPGHPLCPQRYTLTSLLMAAVVMLILTVVIVTFLLLGLHITETHTEAVRGGSHGAAAGSGRVRVRMGLSMTRLCPKQLLVGYRSWRHSSCCITRMDPDSIPGLDTVTESFQRRQVSAGPPRGLQGKLLQAGTPLLSLLQAEMKEDGDKAVPLADRSILGTSINILCSTVPVYWA